MKKTSTVFDENLINKVRAQFGLNVYETKVWLSLLAKGQATIGEIAEISGVPRSRIYDVLESLEKEGNEVVIRAEDIPKMLRGDYKSGYSILRHLAIKVFLDRVAEAYHFGGCRVLREYGFLSCDDVQSCLNSMLGGGELKKVLFMPYGDETYLYHRK